jgi:hypothetical protein
VRSSLTSDRCWTCFCLIHACQRTRTCFIIFLTKMKWKPNLTMSPRNPTSSHSHKNDHHFAHWTLIHFQRGMGDGPTHRSGWGGGEVVAWDAFGQSTKERRRGDEGGEEMKEEMGFLFQFFGWRLTHRPTHENLVSLIASQCCPHTSPPSPEPCPESLAFPIIESWRWGGGGCARVCVCVCVSLIFPLMNNPNSHCEC